MNNYHHRKRSFFGSLSEETVAIILVVVFLTGLAFYVYNGIRQYDDLKIRFMVTTDYERDHETEEEPLIPFLQPTFIIS